MGKYWTNRSGSRDHTLWFPSLRLAKVMAIPVFFQEILGILFKKSLNFEYEVIWRTPICKMAMAITYFFQKFFTLNIFTR
jgi:hypothetical protein